MFKSFATLAVAALADDVTPEAPTTSGILKYVQADAVTAKDAATPPADVCSASINSQITYAGSTVVNQTNSYISTSFALATGGTWTGNIDETAEVATCYKDGQKYYCQVYSYTIPSVTPSSGGDPVAGTAVFSIVLGTEKISLPNFDATSSLSSQLDTATSSSTCTLKIDSESGCPGFVINSGQTKLNEDKSLQWAFNEVYDFSSSTEMDNNFTGMQAVWKAGVTVAVYYNAGQATPASVGVVAQTNDLVITPTTPTPTPTPTPDPGSSAYAMAALGAGLALLSAF